MSYPDVFLPSEWFSHEMQFQMMAAGLKTPVYTQGLSELFGYPLPDKEIVYVPAFGDLTLKNVFAQTGGNPIAKLPRSELCIVITPTIDKFSYSKTIHGIPTFAKDLMGDDDDTLDDLVYVEPGHLPHGFRESAERAQRIALDTICQYTDQKFSVVGTKLSPLSSGKGNIAMFVHFPDGCPFERQEFLMSDVFDATMNKNIQIRVIPKPLVSKFEDYNIGLKFSIRFMEVDRNLFDLSFPIIRHFVETSFANSNLRFIKPNIHTHELIGVVQTPEVPSNDELDAFCKAVKSAKYAPYVVMDVLLETVYIN